MFTPALAKAAIADAQATKECPDIKREAMKNYLRDLLVLYKDAYNEDLLQHEVESLHRILINVENYEVFCGSHELVARNKITTKARSIMKAISRFEMKPFYFLVNKN